MSGQTTEEDLVSEYLKRGGVITECPPCVISGGHYSMNMAWDAASKNIRMIDPDTGNPLSREKALKLQRNRNSRSASAMAKRRPHIKRMMREGMSHKDIADHLVISEEALTRELQYLRRAGN